MDRRALAERLARNAAALQLDWTQADPALARRYGFALAWRAGVACFSAKRPLFGDSLSFGHGAIGFGTLAPATEAVLDRVRRHYARLGTPCRVEVIEGLMPAAVERLLSRAGLSRESFAFDLHVLEAVRPPRIAPVPGVTVELVRPRQARRFSELATAAFGDRGRSAEYFTRTRIRLLRGHPRRVAGVWALVEGEPAGTGMLLLGAGVGSLGAGAVLRRHRGQGIQTRIIAERVRIGLARGVWLFSSRTHENEASAHNLHDAGFRRRGSMVAWSERG